MSLPGRLQTAGVASVTRHSIEASLGTDGGLSRDVPVVEKGGRKARIGQFHRCAARLPDRQVQECAMPDAFIDVLAGSKKLQYNFTFISDI
jgi:hypothetical protein